MSDKDDEEIDIDPNDLPFGPNNPPENMHYMGYDYEIVGSAFDGETGNYYYGTCSHLEQKIRLRKGLTYEQAVDTLMHEVFHVIWRFSGLGKKASEEKVIGVFGTGMLAFFKANPHIYEWMGSLMYPPDDDEQETQENDQ